MPTDGATYTITELSREFGITTRTIRHSEGAYPVYIELGSHQSLMKLVTRHCGDRVPIIITDETVARLIPQDLSAIPCLTFPPGEASKTRLQWERLTDAMLAHGIGRDGAVIAFGGGVTGDLAGFVASTYHRGLPVLHVPTSLLAMIDASIGGKTAVDTPAGKNLVGTFHQPVAVVIDPIVLESLPAREFRTGLSEAIKHALIADAELFAWLGLHASELLSSNSALLEELIRRCIAVKATVVEGDEREAGRRAVLNAGHTVAHAIEAQSGYAISHGEAVAIGLVVECRIAERMGLCETGTATRVAALLEQFQLPVAVPLALTTDALLDRMKLDKKNREGAIRCALVSGIGTMVGARDGGWTQEVDLSLMQELLSPPR